MRARKDGFFEHHWGSDNDCVGVADFIRLPLQHVFSAAGGAYVESAVPPLYGERRR
jgi:hypothetical protein